MFSGVGWLSIVLGALFFAWSMLLDVRWKCERRLARWWLRAARRFGLVSFSFGFSFLMLGVHALAVAWVWFARDREGVLAVAGLACWLTVLVVYAPFVVYTAPLQGSASPYRGWRGELRAAGAQQREERRIAWTGGIPSFVGFLMIVATCLVVFPPR